jgi:hypothetical protein
MNHSTFDNNIKNALQDLELPYDASTWGPLSDRLDRLQALEGDQESDALFQHRLSNLEAPFRTDHWAAMSAQLDRVAQVRRRMLFVKFAEAAIFLLLVANIHFFFTPDAPDSSKNGAKATVSTQKDSKSRISQKKNKGNISTATANAAPENTALGALTALWNSGTEQRTNTPSTPETSTTDVTHTDGNAPVASLLDPAVFYNNPGMVRFDQMAPLPPVRPEPIAYQIDNLTLPQYTQKAPRNAPWYASTFVSFNRDNIRPNATGSVDKNTGGGFAIGVRKGAWGLETGLAYSDKRYEPKKSVEIYDGSATTGFYGTYATEVTADVVSIPLKASKRVAKVGKATVHATAGVTAHVVAQKEFRYKTVFYPGFSQQSDPQPVPAPKQRQVGRGVFEGGELSNNAFVSADLGIRLEHPIGKRYVAFVEPSLRAAVGNKGFGPSDTRISGVAIQAGIMGGL